MPELPPELNAAHPRVLQYADKLFAALAGLEAAGGMKALASGLKPAAVERTAQALKSTRQALDEQPAGFKAARRR